MVGSMVGQGSRGSQDGRPGQDPAQQLGGGSPAAPSPEASEPAESVESQPTAETGAGAPGSVAAAAKVEALQAEVDRQKAETERLTARLTTALQAVAQLTEARRQLQQDFDRYRERTRAEQESLDQKVTADLIRKFLAVVDDLERAAQAATSCDVERARQALVEGVQLVLDEARRLLQEQGVELVPAAGQPFDPQVHEALGYQPAEGVPEGTVVEEVRRGYRLRSQLLRPALVVVARGGQSSQQTPAASAAAAEDSAEADRDGAGQGRRRL